VIKYEDGEAEVEALWLQEAGRCLDERSGAKRAMSQPRTFFVEPILPSEVSVSTAKNEVLSLLQKLPDDCTLEDIQYHLYVLTKIRRGIEQAERGETLSQEEVERRLAKWISE